MRFRVHKAFAFAMTAVVACSAMADGIDLAEGRKWWAFQPVKDTRRRT